MEERDSRRSGIGTTSRRTFLKAGGASGIFGAVGASGASADEHDEGDDDGDDGGRRKGRTAADTVLFNGSVVTMDSDEPRDSTVADAVAIRDGRIEAVGSRGDVMPLAGQRTRQIDLDGRSVIPGLIDTHLHLQSFATGRDWAAELAPALAATPVETDDDSWEGVKNATIETVEREANDAGDGDWVHVSLPRFVVTPGGNEVAIWEAAFAPFGSLLGLEDTLEPPVTRKELSSAAPDNPVFAAVGFASVIFNDAALRRIRDHYGDIGARTHEPTGVSGVLLARGAKVDLLIQDRATREEIMRRESQDFVRHGVTTWSTSTYGTETVKAFAAVAERGELAQRYAYSHGMGHTSTMDGPGFYTRKGEPNAMTTRDDFVWQAGATITNVDHIAPLIETSFEPPEISEKAKALEFSWSDLPNEDLPEDVRSYQRRVIKAQLRAGYPLTGNHVVGDVAQDEYMDLIEEVMNEPDIDADRIRAMGNAIDHFRMLRPDQIPRLAELGITASVAPKYIGETLPRMGFSDEALETLRESWQVPTKDLIDAGVHTCWHLDTDPSDKPGTAFWFLEKLVTREIEGTVYNADNRVDRLTALAMATRWAADYVSRPDAIGSIEPGKLADLVVLERDFLDVPDDEIHTVNPVIVMVGGQDRMN